MAYLHEGVLIKEEFSDLDSDCKAMCFSAVPGMYCPELQQAGV